MIKCNKCRNESLDGDKFCRMCGNSLLDEVLVHKTIKEEPISKIDPTIKEAISISNFSMKYKKSQILKGININITRGELVCLLGPSGSGKSIIIESLVGRKQPTKQNRYYRIVVCITGCDTLSACLIQYQNIISRYYLLP